MRHRILTAALAGLAVVGLTATAAAGGSGGTSYNTDLRKATFTVFEVSDSLAIVDVTATRLDVPPGSPGSTLGGRPGPGDVLLIESSLYGDAVEREQDTQPLPFPGAPQFELPFDTFDPVGDPVGDVVGTCTFVRYVDERPEFEDRLAQCSLTFRLPQGDLVAAGLLDVSALEAAEPTVLPLAGGTGIYSKARGTVTLTQPSVPAFDRFSVEVSWKG